MSLDGAPPNPHRQLLLDDVQQSLTGLRVSLGQDSPGMPQASLHARDLAHGLAMAGLAPLSELAEALAQRLAKGEEGAIFLGRGLATQVAPWIEQARAGQTPSEAALTDMMAHWRERLLGSAPPVPGLMVDNLSDPVAQPLALQGLDTAALHGIGLPTIAAIRGDLAQPDFSAQGLDVRLAALEDWLVSLGHYALSDLYPGPAHQVAGAWGDETLMQMLRKHLDWADRSSLIRASTTRLTLRLDWVGARLDEEELGRLGKDVAELDGRVQALPEGGWRLWLPACRRRMRLQTFTRDGQPWAISAALLETWPGASAQTLHLRLGNTELNLAVQSVGLQASMNLHPIPATVPMPPGVLAAAADPAGGLFPVLKLGGAGLEGLP